MSRFPLADAIREARRAADRSRVALARLQRARAALRGLELLGPHRDALHLLDGLPGDDLVAELADEDPEPAPGPSADRAGRIAARRAWLTRWCERLEAEAGEAEHRAVALHELQEAQREILRRPEHADAAARLATLQEERQRIAEELGALEWQVVQLETALCTVDQLRGLLHAEVASGASARAAELAREAVGSLARVLAEVRLDLSAPEVADGEDVLVRLVGALGTTRAAIVGRLEPVLKARDERRRRHEELVRSIEGETG